MTFAGHADDPVDGDLTDEIEWSAVLHHNVHTHPDLLPPTTGAGGSFTLLDHDDNTYVELCAEVANSAGGVASDCVDIRPRTAMVTVDSVPGGREVSFGEAIGNAPLAIAANVGATRVLSVPESSGCFEFESWSDGGEATHTITVPAQGATYTATFSDACPPTPAPPRRRSSHRSPSPRARARPRSTPPATATTPSFGAARPGAPGGSAAASRLTGPTTSRRSPTRRASRSMTS